MSGISTAIIMRSKDEMPHAVAALQGLARQSWTDWTLYNVDSGSTDGTLETLRAFNPDRITEIPPRAYIPGKVLNDMIARTTEEWIVFLNADAIPLNDAWLERLLRPLLDGAADATMSKQHARPDALFIVDYDYRRAYDPRNIKDENEDFFSAVACAFRRSWWERIKFPESGYAEDLAWAKACFHSGCSSANTFSPTWPPARQRSENWCRARPMAFQSVLLAWASAQALTSSIRA